MFNWYENPDKGAAGQLCNLAVSRVETFAAGGNIKAGAPLKYSDGTVVALSSAKDKGAFVGVALTKHGEPYDDGYSYHKGDEVPVITLGDVYMTVEAAATRGYVFTLADGTDGVKLTPVAKGTADAFSDLECAETADAGIVAVRVKA